MANTRAAANASGSQSAIPPLDPDGKLIVTFPFSDSFEVTEDVRLPESETEVIRVDWSVFSSENP